ncbi:hypothetical protein COJ96_09795 [Bacillus sp. AFS073361]|uniref:hypothetical protein n=1 Tax=Bacillus sp. AFS073361 TaxID=2033511 RepID=UPI000BF4EEBF|nr:hypothetical protein [Bacillus sp. AFS073361]PFP29434.1 hypothetical protein COJ96_09795 [Bacillus sp. AFS073361]
MAADVHTQKIVSYLAIIQSKFFTGRSEVLLCRGIFANHACNRTNEKATGSATVRNAESLPRKKIGATGTVNIRKENDGLRTKIRVLSVQTACFSGFKKKVKQ